MTDEFQLSPGEVSGCGSVGIFGELQGGGGGEMWRF